MTMLIFNTDFKSERHIAWFTEDRGNKIALFEVVERFYPHPEAPENAVLSQFETKFVVEYSRGDFECGSSVLLEAAQSTISQIQKTKKRSSPECIAEVGRKVQEENKK